MSASFDQNAAKERVRDATDIVDLVGHYIPLKRSGRNYVGRCPWHDDTRPSLQVNPERQTFKCWVCDIGGDVFAFTMKIENVEFREALEILADKAGIALPKHQKIQSESGETEITRKQLFRAAQWVAKNYHDALLHHDEAEVVRQYLQERNLSLEAIERFNIGYAPIDRNWLANQAKSKAERIKVLEIIGNFRSGNNAEISRFSSGTHSRSDFFRGRLIFPIRDEQGRTVAFGGRLVPHSPLSDDPWHKDRKYLNSPETVLFSKHKVLYGLDIAKQRIKEVRRALVMEGYTDCIAAHQFGFSEAVAVLGTALGPAHIRLLNRMGAEKIILMLDGDKAGQAKAESDKVLIDFIEQGADMSVLTLPEGLDPCEFLEKYGTEALNTLLEKETVDALDHVFQSKTRGVNLNDAIASSNALDSILGIIAHAPMKGRSPDDPIRLRVEKTVQNLSVRFTMPDDVIRRRLHEKQRKAENRSVTEEYDEIPMQTPQHFSKEELPDLLERNMLELWIMDPTAVYAFWEHVFPEQLRSPITRQIYNMCSELAEQRGRPATFDNLMTAFDDTRMKNFLVELEVSGRRKFFGESDESDIESALREELTERWKEPEFVELKLKLTSEIIAAFDKRESDKKRRGELNKLRNPELSDEEKLQQLLELQRKLRGK